MTFHDFVMGIRGFAYIEYQFLFLVFTLLRSFFGFRKIPTVRDALPGVYCKPFVMHDDNRNK